MQARPPDAGRARQSPAGGRRAAPCGLIRSASLHGYAELVQGLGHDPASFVRAAGLSARLLDDPETLIPIHAVRALLETAARATGVADFGLRLAARRQLDHLGPISLVLREEPTPRQALDTLCRYLKLLSAGLFVRIEEAGGGVLVRQDLVPIAGLAVRQSMELSVGVMHRVLRELIGAPWRPQQVSFMHGAPADVSAHRAFFGVPPLFGQPFNGMVCRLADLQRLRGGGDGDGDGGHVQASGVARFARGHLEQALRCRGEGVEAACRALILALLPGGRCTVQQVARLMGMDRRTLHRRLQAEGQSFSALLDATREDLVLRHLQEGGQSLGEVAGLLGFAAPSGFCHWFRARFGASVSDWRRQSLQRGIAPTAELARQKPKCSARCFRNSAACR